MSDILVEVAEAVPVEVNLPAKDNAIEMEVYYQDEVSLDTDLSLFYIKSGEKEIENYVENVSKPEIDNYIETYAKPIVSEVVDNIATPIIDEYFEETVKPSIAEFANKEMAGYAAEATAQAAIATAAATEASATAQTVDVKVAEFSEQTEASKQEFIAFAGEKTEEFEQTAQQATADSLANVEKSRIWAEGEQAEVKPLGGELSSMGAADLAYAIANAPEDTPIDASGLFAMSVVKGPKGDKGDKGDAGKDGVDGKSVFDGYATNCITEIPQDIKLELNDGTLTLKAGSKVYVPNEFEADGVTPKFDEVVVENNVSTTRNTGKAKEVYVYGKDNQTFTQWFFTTSGASAPSGDTYMLWYDTSTNRMKSTTNGGSTWNVTNMSLPVCLASSNTTQITSIDQVFNGFGYIGSTVFALPNVKGLIPNGRNEDGSLRNTEFVTNKMFIRTYSGDYTNVGTLGFNPNLEIPFSISGAVTYDKIRNINLDVGGVNNWDRAFVGNIAFASAKITSFNPKLPFHALDRNDSSWVAQQAMPSSKYIDLTLGASGTEYTAPANGMFILNKSIAASSSGQHVNLFVNSVLRDKVNSSLAHQTCLTALVKKGDVLKVEYNATGTTNMFRFYYAEGEK